MPDAVAPQPRESAIRRARRSVRRYRARTQGLAGAASLVVRARLGLVEQVWVGDSHSVTMNSPRMVTALSRRPGGLWICHLGPRLMYSVASNGLPPALLRTMRMIGSSRRAPDIVWAFSFGEIDVRCHLVPRMADPEAALAFVPAYLQRIHEAATLAGARRALVLVPPPQSDGFHEEFGFPIVGTIEERVAANLAVRDALVRAAAELPADGAALHLVDVTDDFSDERGAVKEALTYDGLHANDTGREIFRRRVDEVLRTAVKGAPA
jgi:lysophospholipase L1-like esterase